MMIVLDTLRSEDPNLRRVGETWMRCSLKSYLRFVVVLSCWCKTDMEFWTYRLLDPFLYDLCDPSICRSPTSAQYNGREIRSFVYDRPMDQHYVIHLMNVLSSVIKFGGASFTKVARSTQMSRCTHSGLQERVRDCAYYVLSS